MARKGKAEIELNAQDKTRAAFDAVNRRLDALGKQADRQKQRFEGLGRVFTGALAGLSVAGTFSAFIRESTAAQNEQQQLAAVIESTGKAAGFTRDQLNEMAEALASESTFGAGDINRAQTRLLSYTGIVGEQFPQAMQAVIDMAARMGMSVEQSAETIGRALDIPSQGLTALTKQGFRFTEEQKKVVEALELTGRTGEAQQIILSALQSSYGGAAKAARDTFGGALIGLQEELKSLITGDDGSLDGARQSIESLTRTLKSQEVREAFGALTSAMARLIEMAAGVGVTFTTLGERIGRGLASATGNLTELDRIQGRIRDIDDTMRSRWLAPDFETLFASQDELKAMREKLVEQARAMGAYSGYAVSDAGAGRGNINPPHVRPPAPPTKDPEAEKRAERARKEALSYVENLQRQLRATEELSAAETVLSDIQEGRLKLVGGVTENMVLGIALEIDARKALKQALEEQAKATEGAARVSQEQMDALTAEADAIHAQNEALRLSIEEIGKTVDQLAELRAARLENAAAAEEEALAMAKVAGASEAEIQERERRIRLLRQQADLVRDQAQKTAQEMDEFAKNAAQNIQRYLGDQFVSLMEGNFDDLGGSFTKMINRMVAEALAADLARRMFGKAGGGQGEGWFGSVLSWFGSMMGGGRAHGGAVAPGAIHPVTELGEPELLRMSGRQYLITPEAGVVEPMSATEGGGKTINVNVTQNFPPGTTRQTATQAAAEAQRALRQGARNL